MTKDKKQELIIETALKRFAHFGVAKTTMTEIANDLAISKGLLYYYFPDKLALYAAVLDTIVTEAEQNGRAELEAEQDVFKAILMVIDGKNDFITRYYSIFEYLNHMRTGVHVPDELKIIFDRGRQFQINIFRQIMERGHQNGVLKVDDLDGTATLLVEVLDGLRFSVVADTSLFLLDKNVLQLLFQKEKELVRIFFKGLTC